MVTIRSDLAAAPRRAGILISAMILAYLSTPTLVAQTLHSDGKNVMLTVPIDGVRDAVFFYDTLSHDLTGHVLNARGVFNVVYKINLDTFFKGPGGMPIAAPKFLFASGKVSLAPGRGVTWARGAIYVTEVTTGQMIAFALPWRAGFPAAKGKALLKPIAVQRLKVGVGKLDE